jgi:hypothetical protein
VIADEDAVEGSTWHPSIMLAAEDSAAQYMDRPLGLSNHDPLRITTICANQRDGAGNKFLAAKKPCQGNPLVAFPADSSPGIIKMAAPVFS